MDEPSFQVLSFQRDDNDGTARLQARRYQKRKTHRKSRGGCSGCKVKRVKCDEAKPTCKRCQRSRTPCLYGSDEGSGNSLTRSIRHERPSGDGSSPLSVDLSLSPFDASLGLDQRASPFGTPRIVLLRHSALILDDLKHFGAKDSNSFINLGLSRPHLLDAILAVSASHLRVHSPSPAPHRVAEHFQQSLSLRGFQGALSEPLVDYSGSDALLLTGMLLNLLAFSTVDGSDDESVARSWVFSDSPDRLSWFALQLGYKPLLLATRPWHGDGSILHWMFDASDDDQHTYHGGPRHLHRVPAHWLRLCDLTPEDDSGESIFYEPLRLLAEVKNLEPVAANYFLYLSPMGGFDLEFRDLLQANDERAMWVFGYWLGLSARFDHWWVRNMVRRDGRAIKLWLERRGVRERGGLEGQMWADLMDDLDRAPRWIGTPSLDTDIYEISD